MNHSLTSAELDAIESHLKFLAAAAEQDGRHCHSGGLDAARRYLATTRNESFARRADKRREKRSAIYQLAGGFPR